MHYELPELGAIGGHRLANPRDFETPVASFDVDQSPWEIVYKCVPRKPIISTTPEVTILRLCMVGLADSSTCTHKAILHLMSSLGMESKSLSFIRSLPSFLRRATDRPHVIDPQLRSLQVCFREIRTRRQHLCGPHRSFRLLRADCQVQDPWHTACRFSDLSGKMGRRIAYV